MGIVVGERKRRREFNEFSLNGERLPFTVHSTSLTKMFARSSPLFLSPSPLPTPLTLRLSRRSIRNSSFPPFVTRKITSSLTLLFNIAMTKKKKRIEKYCEINSTIFKNDNSKITNLLFSCLIQIGRNLREIVRRNVNGKLQTIYWK